MTRTPLPGASYPVELVGGEFVRFYERSHFETHLGRVPLPPHDADGVLALDATVVGGFKFAGLGWSTGVIWEWTASTGKWRSIPGPLASPVVYDSQGTLRYEPIPSGGSWSSQGYRFVDEQGRVWTGDETYLLHGIAQWSRIADLMVGQAHHGGGVVVRSDRDGVLRKLEDGECYFIKSRTDGVRAVVSIWKPHEGGSVVFRGALSELRALPKVGTNVPNPGTPAPPPVPTPEPKPMEAKALPADVHAIVVALYLANKDLAHGNDDDRRKLQRKICETVRARKGASWGWKSNHGIGIANAKDAIAELPEGATFTPNQRQPLYMWDLFNGWTREPNPAPIMSDTAHVEQFFVPVEPIDHLAGAEPEPAPTPGPTPAPQPPPGDIIAAILKRLHALEGPRTVAIRSAGRDHYMRDDWSDNAAKFDRTAVGSGEIFIIEPQD